MIISDSFNNRAFVIFGGALSDSDNLVDRADWIIMGEKLTDQFGYILSSSDFDSDGFKDLNIGSRSHVLTDRADPHFNDAGAVYVFYSIMHRTYLPLLLKSY